MLGGFLVGVSVLRVMCVEFCMMSAMSVPLWSSVGENHRSECALMSAVIIVFGNVVRCARVLSISESSVAWLWSVVFLGGMYMFAMCTCFCCVRCILVICSSVFCVLMWVGMFSGVKVTVFLMYVISPPPFLCVLSVLWGVKFVMLGVLWWGESLVSCIVMISML